MKVSPISQSDDTLCLSHISDPYLLLQLTETVEGGSCVVCFRRRLSSAGPVVRIELVASVVYRAILRTYDHEGFCVDGVQALESLPIERVVAELLIGAVNVDIINQVSEILSDLIADEADWFVPFDMDHGAGVEFEWNDFEDSIKHESRLLTPARHGSSPKSAAEKNHAFVESLLSLTEERMGLVRIYGRGTKLYRARTDRDGRELELRARNAPARELGPAPRQRASAGRMNAQGVPMFYAARDPRTACAEVAAHSPYDDTVVGTFVLQQPLRILDLTAVPPSRSPFDDRPISEGDDRLNSLSFYVERITQPVILDGNHPVDYAPTQVLTDALREWSDPRLDGIAYPSRVSDSGGTNVVLFYADRMWFESPDEPSSRFEAMVRLTEHERKTSLFRISPSTVRRYQVSRKISVARSNS